MGEIINIPAGTLANNMAEFQERLFKIGVVSGRSNFGFIVTSPCRCALYDEYENRVSYLLYGNTSFAYQAGRYRIDGLYTENDTPYTSEYGKSFDSTYGKNGMWHYITLDYSAYNTKEEALIALSSLPITYRNTNCVHSGPDSASPGDVVSVDYTFADGYGIVNPSTDIYVTNNGVIVPSSYSNGTLTFTMPDSSE